jgi:hypothetical protein
VCVFLLVLWTTALRTGVAVQKRDACCTVASSPVASLLCKSAVEDLAARRIAKQAVCVARCGLSRTWCEEVGVLTLRSILPAEYGTFSVQLYCKFNI